MNILIIGAGPIGCYTARLLKKRNPNINITLIEEHGQIGKPVHCAGLVSKSVFTEMELDIDDNIIINRIDGAEIFLNGESFKIRRKDVALVIDRARFDSALGDGLKVDFNTRFVGIENNKNGYLVETDKGEYYADIVIGADGANSSFRRAGGFKEDIEQLRGVQFRIRYDKCNNNLVRVYLRIPFFAWIIPESQNVIRAGIISDNPYHDLNEFLQEEKIKGEILEKFAGVVPVGKCSTQNNKLFLVGDAACQVKPLTHGGIYYGMRCAEILVDCITNGKLSNYENTWRRKFEKEIDIGLKAKKLYKGLSQENISKVFALLKKNVGLLERFGDFENHSKVISVIIKNPRLQGLLGRIFIGILKDG